MTVLHSRVRRFVAVSTGVATAAAMIALTQGVATAHGGSGGVRTIASGLDNPRGLTFDRNGTLYVAESGRGGAGPCFEGPEGEVCFGTSGAITRVRHGEQKRIVEGMPSTAAPDGSGASGPSDVAVRWGDLYFTVGLGGDPALRSELPAAGAKLATLQKVLWNGKVKQVADLGAFEAAENPDGDLPDSNPNGLLARDNGFYVADAGGNSLVRVKNNGKPKTVATFPERIVPFPGPTDEFSMDPVPTNVVKGPDGAYYVSELTGFPFPVDGAQVWRIKNGKAKVYAKGFTNVMDLGFDRYGRLYVLEINSNGLQTQGPGSLIRVGKNGSQKVIHTGLIMPGGLAIRGDNAYVTNCGVCAGGGTVLRIPL